MAKHWTYDEDRYLHQWVTVVGAFIVAHDLGRPQAAVEARARILRKTGAWKALDDMQAALAAYRHSLGKPGTIEELFEGMDAREAERPAKGEAA